MEWKKNELVRAVPTLNGKKRGEVTFRIMEVSPDILVCQPAMEEKLQEKAATFMKLSGKQIFGRELKMDNTYYWFDAQTGDQIPPIGMLKWHIYKIEL